MSKTNRDRNRNYAFDEEDEDYKFRKETKKRRKKNRRFVDQSLKDIVRTNGEFDESELDEEMFFLEEDY